MLPASSAEINIIKKLPHKNVQELYFSSENRDLFVSTHFQHIYFSIVQEAIFTPWKTFLGQSGKLNTVQTNYLVA